ncbi:MAG: DUF3137 domain-containing protein, partial [Bdellovibrionales bacterium]|nr:DUF3137 domain-containing protein [Bdellovibrionales bacterium]
VKTWGPLVGAGLLVIFLFKNAQESTLKLIVQWIGMGAAAFGGFHISKDLRTVLMASVKRAQAQRVLISEFKVKIIKSLCKTFSYSPTNPFPVELYKSCGLFSPSYDTASSEDHVVGQLEKTQFELQEIKTFNKESYKDSKGRRQTRYIPIFKGILFLADFNKNFKGHTVVKTDTAEKALGLLGRSAQRLFSATSSLKLVELENPEFESQFKVLSTDPVEARYILSASFMEALTRLRGKYGAGVQVSFLNSTIVIAIPHDRGFMDFGFSLDNLTRDASKMCEELYDILEIVEDLELNNRIWNKNNKQAGA